MDPQTETNIDFAGIVERRLDALGWTVYRLHQEVVGGGHAVSSQTIYNFLNNGKLVTNNTLAAILKAVRVVYVADPTSPQLVPLPVKPKHTKPNSKPGKMPKRGRK